jgi:hypothetical protein
MWVRFSLQPLSRLEDHNAQRHNDRSRACESKSPADDPTWAAFEIRERDRQAAEDKGAANQRQNLTEPEYPEGMMERESGLVT